jgi:hypothetical protein
MPNRVNRGWKPFPQSISLNLTSLGFFSWFQKGFFFDQTGRFFASSDATP